MSLRLLLRLEGAVVVFVAVIAYTYLDASWWLFGALLLVPDVFMIGYVAGPRIGAHVYNVGHTYILPVGLGAAAVGTGSLLLGAIAVIWAAHIGMDRALGYGLKYPAGFHDTHLTRSEPTPASRSSQFPAGTSRVVAGTALFGLVLGLAGCQSSPALEPGRWTGTLTPMNHPDMATPIGYDVRHEDDRLVIDLIGPNETTTPTRTPRVKGDTLFFSFDEPDEQTPLRCALVRTKADGYAGRCVDPAGKWARFTMMSPTS